MSRRGTNIRKRTDGRWEGRYYIVDTAGSKKCKSVYGHSYKEVTERLLTAKAASLNQTAAPKQPAITVKAVAEKWLESIATSRKCSTIQKYSTIYNKYIKPNWGESVIDELNQNEILKELPETAGESITKSILCIFNSILAYGAATYGTGEIHLSYRAKRSSVTSSNNINTINTTDQQKLTEYLLTELDIYKLGILLCLFMGLRLGEICALKWEDIDMISRTLHVNRTVQRLPVDTVHTSGSSQNNHTATRKTSLYIDSPKTSNSLREIPIPDFIYDKLSDYYNTSIKGDSYFLKKNQPMDPRTYQNRFHIYIREAGIGNTHFHALRHTFATNCISSGADAKSVKEIEDVNVALDAMQQEYDAVFPDQAYEEAVFKHYPIILRSFDMTSEEVMQDFVLRTIAFAETSFDYMLVLQCDENGAILQHAIKFPKRFFKAIQEALVSGEEITDTSLLTPYPIDVTENMLECFSGDWKIKRQTDNPYVHYLGDIAEELWVYSKLRELLCTEEDREYCICELKKVAEKIAIMKKEIHLHLDEEVADQIDEMCNHVYEGNCFDNIRLNEFVQNLQYIVV